MKKITAQLLIKHNACPDQVILFRKTFPAGAKPTLANMRKADKAGLSVLWAARLLTGKVAKDYWAKLKPLDEDYWAKRMLLAEDYRAKCKPLGEDYWAKRKPLDEDYWAKRMLLAEDYWAKLKSLDEDYEAKHKPLNDDYWAKRKLLDEDYRAKLKLLLLTALKKQFKTALRRKEEK